MTKTAFFVIGCESAGTRMLTRSLISSGVWGDGDHQQRLDAGDLRIIKGDKVVFRRSLPHAGSMPNITDLKKRFEDAGWMVKIIKIRREKFYNIRSMQMRGHATTPQIAEKKFAESKRFLDLIDGMEIDYHTFVTDRDYRIEHFARLGLSEPKLTYYDGDKKY